MLEKQPAPYSGTKDYIFLSYAHKDKENLFEIAARMQEQGFRIWYDEGIDPGAEWDENIAAHIEEAGYFIAFISAGYLESENCKDELNLARDLDKKRLLVYLEDVSLPLGMQMRLNRLQAIHKYTYAREEDFYEKLFAASGIQSFQERQEKNAVPSDVLELVRRCKETFQMDGRLLTVAERTGCFGARMEEALREERRENVRSFRSRSMEEWPEALEDGSQKDWIEADVLCVEELELLGELDWDEEPQREFEKLLRRRMEQRKKTVLISHVCMERLYGMTRPGIPRLLRRGLQIDYAAVKTGTEKNRVLIRTDEEGKQSSYELLARIYYEGEKYSALLPCEGGEAVIWKLQDSGAYGGEAMQDLLASGDAQEEFLASFEEFLEEEELQEEP